MTYGIFNLASGNLIDSIHGESNALALVSALREEDGVNMEILGVGVVDEHGRTIASLHGAKLQDAIDKGRINTATHA